MKTYKYILALFNQKQQLPKANEYASKTLLKRHTKDGKVTTNLITKIIMRFNNLIRQKSFYYFLIISTLFLMFRTVCEQYQNHIQNYLCNILS